jgi:agmatine/peptidylarginine deiminase
MPHFIVRPILVCLTLMIPLEDLGHGESPAERDGQRRLALPTSQLALPEEPGAFARLDNEQRLVRPGILVPSPPDGVNRRSPSRLPADFEPVEAILVVGDRLGREFPDVLRRLAAAVTTQARLRLLVADAPGRLAVERLLASVPVPRDRLDFVEVPTDTVWLRDFGPVFVTGTDGSRAAIDLEYSLRNRHKDNAVASLVARAMGTPSVRLPVLLEGGNLLSNGQGLCVVTALAMNRNIGRGYDAAAVIDGLRKSLGIEQLVVLEPLWGDPTGHVDMFACFTAADTIVVGAYPASLDPTSARILDRNAAMLAKVRLGTGPLRVVRVPMPSHEDGVWRTYTNGIFANRLYLMPTYAGVDLPQQTAAMDVFRKLLPGWEVTGLDAGPLIKEGGALRCISVQVPAAKR